MRKLTMISRIVMPTFVLLIAFGVHASAVELAPTPVTAAMRTAIESRNVAFAKDKEFDQISDNKKVEPVRVGSKVSIVKAGALSALLPGAGQWYLGERSTARYFFAAEGGIWAGFAAFRIYGGWKEDDYVRLAEERAGAHVEGQSDEYIDFVSFYNSIDDYNGLGRALEPTRPYYSPDDPNLYWRWESETYKDTFRSLKNRSREAYRRSNFMIGAAVLNRVASAIDAIILARKARAVVGEGFSILPNTRLTLDAKLFAAEPSVSFKITTLLP